MTRFFLYLVISVTLTVFGVAGYVIGRFYSNPVNSPVQTSHLVFQADSLANSFVVPKTLATAEDTARAVQAVQSRIYWFGVRDAFNKIAEKEVVLKP